MSKLKPLSVPGEVSEVYALVMSRVAHHEHVLEKQYANIDRLRIEQKDLKNASVEEIFKMAMEHCEEDGNEG